MRATVTGEGMFGELTRCTFVHKPTGTSVVLRYTFQQQLLGEAHKMKVRAVAKLAELVAGAPGTSYDFDDTEDTNV